jgi:stage V sporulation protein R
VTAPSNPEGRWEEDKVSTGGLTSGDQAGEGPSKPSKPQGSPLPDDLERDVEALTQLARERGLRFWETRFEMVTRRHMVELGTYVLPYRWGHWTFGRDYARMQKLHDLGLVEILELVINTRPANAYLLDANSRDENRMVIAHVLGHVDFFANNMWFQRTPDNILVEANYHERRIRELAVLYGQDELERVLDRALSIQWHVDFYRFYGQADEAAQEEEDEPEGRTWGDRWGGIAPRRGPSSLPPPPLVPGGHRDLLEFLVEHGDLSELEREVLQIVREETLYFYPNAVTKIMNEGWATYWHAELLREYLPFDAFDRFAVKHAQLMQAPGLNPYKLGFMIYEDIRQQWDREHGPGAGLARIMEVRRFSDDASFIREHLSQHVVDKAGLYLYEEDPESGERVVTSTRLEDVRESILMEIENMGRPIIEVESGDHRGKGELLLSHRFDGRELDLDAAGDVLKQVQGFWKRPVRLLTRLGGRKVRLDFDGEEVRVERLEDPEDQKQGPGNQGMLGPGAVGEPSPDKEAQSLGDGWIGAENEDGSDPDAGPGRF